MPTVSNEKLKTIIKESVKEALEEEIAKMRLMFLPDVSSKEMHDIVSRYGKPEKKSVRKETIDI